jgi:hypothetical protein
MQSGINNMFRAADFAGAAAMMGAGSDGAGVAKIGANQSSPVGESPWMKYQMKKLGRK